MCAQRSLPPPRIRPSFEEWIFEVVDSLAKRSTCPRRQAGGVAINAHSQIVSTAFNGVPRKFPHCSEGHWCGGAEDPPGDTSRCLAVHAEQNLIINATGPIHTVYLSASPCRTCALLLANLPELRRVVYKERYADDLGLRIIRMTGMGLHQFSGREVTVTGE